MTNYRYWILYATKQFEFSFLIEFLSILLILTFDSSTTSTSIIISEFSIVKNLVNKKIAISQNSNAIPWYSTNGIVHGLSECIYMFTCFWVRFFNGIILHYTSNFLWVNFIQLPIPGIYKSLFSSFVMPHPFIPIGNSRLLNK